MDDPILVVEILSKGDTFSDTARRGNDYLRMGAAAVWIIDPEERTGLVFTGSTWREEEVLSVPGTRIEVSLPALWQDLDREKSFLL